MKNLQKLYCINCPLLTEIYGVYQTLNCSHCPLLAHLAENTAVNLTQTKTLTK